MPIKNLLGKILLFSLAVLVLLTIAVETRTASAAGLGHSFSQDKASLDQRDRQPDAAGTASVSFTGDAEVVPGGVYTYTYKLNVVGAAAANANIDVGGIFEKVSGGMGLFYDTIPQNTTGSSGTSTITVRVKADALSGEQGTIFVKEDESTCTTLTSGLEQQISTVTGSITAEVPEPPAAPTMTSAAAAGFDAIKVSWDAVSDADGYAVYCAKTKNGTYSAVGIVNSNQLSFIHTGRERDRVYYYKVCAYIKVGSLKNYSDYSPSCSAKAGAVPPSNSLASTSYTAIRVSWTAVSGASGYEVWQCTKKYGTYSLKHTSSSGSAGSYTIIRLTTDRTYYYKVRAFITVNGEKVYSDYSVINSEAPGQPAMTVTRASSTSSKITWVSISGSAGYEVWRATKKFGTYSLKYKASSSTTSWTNTGLTTGTAYYYKVYAYRTVSGKKVYGLVSPTNSIIP